MYNHQVSPPSSSFWPFSLTLWSSSVHFIKWREFIVVKLGKADVIAKLFYFVL